MAKKRSVWEEDLNPAVAGGLVVTWVVFLGMVFAGGWPLAVMVPTYAAVTALGVLASRLGRWKQKTPSEQSAAVPSLEHMAQALQLAARSSASALPEPYRQWVEEGRSTCAAIQDVVVRLPVPLRRTFWPLTKQANELVSDLEKLAQSGWEMDQYLSGHHGQKPGRARKQLRKELEKEDDPIVRERIEQTLQALQETISDHREIRTLLQRVEAEARQINASLDSVLSEVIKQRYAHLDTARQSYDSAAERLHSVKSHVDAIQQVITTHSQSGEGRD